MKRKGLIVVLLLALIFSAVACATDKTYVFSYSSTLTEAGGVSCKNEKGKEVRSGDKHAANEKLFLVASENEGYSFAGWYSGEQ